MTFAADLLVECLEAQGMSKALAEKTIGVLMAVQWDGRNPQRWEREAKAYHLRSQRVEVLEISIRFGVTENHVYKWLREHLKCRREALRRAS